MIFTDKYIDFGGAVYYFEKADKMPHDKENALISFICMICRSWTFARLTESEKEDCINSLLFASEQKILKGTYNHRFMILHSIYNAFLSALGYKNGNFREA